MKQYLLSVHYVEGQPAPTEPEMTAMFADTEAFNERRARAGPLCSAAACSRRTQPPSCG